MTLAVMSRATLGHTGRRLEASPATHLIYAAVIVAALARVCAVLEGDHTGALLVVAGIAWAAAFSDLPPPIRWRSGRRAGFDLRQGPGDLICLPARYLPLPHIDQTSSKIQPTSPLNGSQRP